MQKLVEALASGLGAGEAALVASPPCRRLLSGFSASDGLVLVLPETAYFLTDFRYIEAAQRMVRHMPCVQYRDPGDTLDGLLKVHGVERVLLERSYTTLAAQVRWQSALTAEVCGDGRLDKWLDKLRMAKTPAQIAGIRAAQALTDYGFQYILPRIACGRTEREIALELEIAIRREGAQGAAFDFIVVSGPNSALPHGTPGDRTLRRGDFVTLDFGAVLDGWHSDMTRTVALGRVDEEMELVYRTVLDAQCAALAVLRAGLVCAEGDGAARAVIEAAGYGAYFGHGTGHGVGMEVHERPNLSPKSDMALVDGAVVTVEPGIYLPGRWGVRIEDMAAVTVDGCENLTRSPKGLIVL